MRYSISDLAEILGCTTSAIHYYEKEHLIEVEKGKNGHRYYNVVDIFRLLSYAKYRSMEIPMKTIITQFGGEENNYKLIEERETKYKLEALKKAKYYMNLADAIEEHLVSIRKIEQLLNQYEFAQSPEVTIMCDDECGWLSKNRNSQKIIYEWVKAMPVVQLGVMDARMGMSNFGYLVKTKKLKELKLPMDLYTKQLKSTSCLHTIVVADGDFTQQPQKVFEKPFEYAKDKGLKLGEVAWGKILLVEVEKGAKLHPYIELWISLKI
ncbi:MerR family transcriptional regulator [Maledivibacter halophilus]|uniref:Predicted transcriptional regulators n=1 Tax=Maledivibacter halophilus TaxID=36842 RepID=A0A1T5LLG6_9FIRM|nr:MerR family transcriptional regulator [Maledivibacter halophilus]SKC76843.1 Predicted transcriptional regulators [Maledivibacter halophilus]